MSISHTEPARLTCPACGAGFKADAWALVDASERPDLAQALRDGALNSVACPQCGQPVSADLALLFHDPANRRVYFAVPPRVAEHRWREQAQALLYTLVNSLPESERRAYLGDVQVEHELDGVRRAVLRRDRARGRAPAPTAAAAVVREPVPAAAPAPSTTSGAAGPALLSAVQELLAADTEAQFAALVAANPALLSEQGDLLMRQLADQSYAQGERDVGDALRELRATLGRMGGAAEQPPIAAAHEATPTAELAPQPPEAGLGTEHLPATTYQALLQVESPQELLAAARDFPALLEAWADADLAARVDAALDEGNERLAQVVETRREALADLRTQASGQERLLQGARALMAAPDDDTRAAALSEYPILLTDSAQDALFRLAEGARSQGDPRLAEFAMSCRAMLQAIRAGLEAG